MANNNWVCRLAEGETVQRDGKDRLWQIIIDCWCLKNVTKSKIKKKKNYKKKYTIANV